MKGKNTSTFKHKSVLLVDEDQIDNFINERMITTSNFSEEVIVCSSAISALAFLRERLANKSELPEIIFLDLNMPIMDGFGFLEEFDKLVSEYPQLKEKCKIIVLSSSISPTDIDRASANIYVFKYLNKPLTEKYLDAINI